MSEQRYLHAITFDTDSASLYYMQKMPELGGLTELNLSYVAPNSGSHGYSAIYSTPTKLTTEQVNLLREKFERVSPNVNPDRLWKGFRFSAIRGLIGSDHDTNYTWKIGEERNVTGRIAACSNGLHSSVRAFDAHRYVPHAEVYGRVSVSGHMDICSDKVAAERMSVQKFYSTTSQALTSAYLQFTGKHPELDLPTPTKEFLTISDVMFAIGNAVGIGLYEETGTEEADILIDEYMELLPEMEAVLPLSIDPMNVLTQLVTTATDIAYATSLAVRTKEHLEALAKRVSALQALLPVGEWRNPEIFLDLNLFSDEKEEEEEEEEEEEDFTDEEEYDSDKEE